MENPGLTKREAQIMNVLWGSEQPLSAHDILVISPELSRNTIQIVLKKLQTMGFVEVAGFGYNKNALTRTFKPVITQAEYISRSLADQASIELAAYLICQTQDAEMLDYLDSLIAQKRKELTACENE